MAALCSSTMTDYESIIFDLDGTLWDASDSCANGWNIALKGMEIESRKISADDIRQVSGMPFGECISSLFGSLPPEVIEKLGPKIESGERDAIIANGGTLYKGVREGLQKLSSEYRLFLVSNCQTWYLKEFFRHSQTGHLFSGFDCHGNSGHPKSQMIAELIDSHGLGRSIYIGDTASDQSASHRAGVEFGHAGYGFGSVKEADLSFNSFNSVVDKFCNETAV